MSGGQFRTSHCSRPPTTLRTLQNRACRSRVVRVSLTEYRLLARAPWTPLRMGWDYRFVRCLDPLCLLVASRNGARIVRCWRVLPSPARLLHSAMVYNAVRYTIGVLRRVGGDFGFFLVDNFACHGIPYLAPISSGRERRPVRRPCLTGLARLFVLTLSRNHCSTDFATSIIAHASHQ